MDRDNILADEDIENILIEEIPDVNVLSDASDDDFCDEDEWLCTGSGDILVRPINEHNLIRNSIPSLKGTKPNNSELEEIITNSAEQASLSDTIRFRPRLGNIELVQSSNDCILQETRPNPSQEKITADHNEETAIGRSEDTNVLGLDQSSVNNFDNVFNDLIAIGAYENVENPDNNQIIALVEPSEPTSIASSLNNLEEKKPGQNKNNKIVGSKINPKKRVKDQKKTKSKLKSKKDDNDQKKVAKRDDINRKWKKKDLTTTVPTYNDNEGPVEGQFEGCKTATEVFLKFFDKHIVRHLVFQSNLYATERGKNLNLKEEELLVFIGINFLMGYHVLPSLKNYWSTSDDLNVRPVSSAMTRTRFVEILSNLHINDNSTITPQTKDKLHKLRPFIDMINKKFKTLYNGTRELSIDESMILFKGRSSLKQYNPKKPIKRGYKLWCLGDQIGYILNFEVYQGKNETVENEFKEYGLGERVVLSLTKEHWGKGRIVVFDNYFSSIPLLERLKNEQVLACGTLRSDRAGIPDMKSDAYLERGSWDHRYSSADVGIFKWKDSKSILLISNYHGTEETKVKRTQKNGSRIDVKCPQVVKDYNILMGGVDLADRYRALYNVDRKSVKWWHRLFWGLMDITFVNSYVIYGILFEQTTVLEFRRMVAKGLMSYTTTKRKRRSVEDIAVGSSSVKRRKSEFSVPRDVRLGNKGVHWPMFDNKRGRCEVCSKKKIQSRPHSKCSHCKVFLCINDKKNCFADFHEVLL